MSLARVLPAFSVAFIVIYAVALYFNLALFVYYPQVNEFHWTAQPTLPPPPMFYYGWLATSVIGAAGVAVIAMVLPASRLARLWPGWTWLVAVAAILFIAYLNRVWFIH